LKNIYQLKPTKNELLDYVYTYQKDLTEKLDNIHSTFNQEIINEIVLWKVNRYAKIDHETINLINALDQDSKELNKDKTEEILTKMLRVKGIRLPMASTILKFKNPNIYQIIDQRVFRVIYGSQLILSTSVQKNISQYLDYLKELRKIANSFDIPFNFSDRILYEYDKKVNPEKIKY
jgi:thermostable 8-oxoguanine DNA glycosylase